MNASCQHLHEGAKCSMGFEKACSRISNQNWIRLVKARHLLFSDDFGSNFSGSLRCIRYDREMSWRISFYIPIFALCLSVPVEAMAQEAVSSSDSVAEITVTARKRAENIQST